MTTSPKEQILVDHEYDVHYYGRGRQNILEAMEQYARSRAIEFALWRDKYRKDEQAKFAKDFRGTPDAKAAFQTMVENFNDINGLYELFSHQTENKEP